MFFPVTAQYTVFAAGTVKVLGGKCTAKLAKVTFFTYFKTVVKKTDVTSFTYKTAILTMSLCYLALRNIFITFSALKAMHFVVIGSTVITASAVFTYFAYTALAAKAGVTKLVFTTVMTFFTVNTV